MVKRWFSSTLILAIILTAFAATGQVAWANEFDSKQIDSNLNATVIPDHVTLSWSEDPQTTMTLTWRTSVAVDACQVEYRENNGRQPVAITVKPKLFKTATKDATQGQINLYTVTLRGLRPGTQYAYRIGTGSGNWTGGGNFVTEAQANLLNNKFKFLVFGDSQSGSRDVPNYGPWHVTVQNAFNANKTAAFFMNMGDLVESGQCYQHWNNWYNAAKGVIDTIPEMVVQGNHETYNGVDAISTKPEYFVSQFPVFGNGPQNFKGQTYSFNYGKVHLVILDSQGEEESRDSAGKVDLAREKEMFQEQAAWLSQDLEQNRDASFTFVFFHKTPYYNKGNRTNVLIKDTFCPIFDRYHVDVVFNAHDHATSRTFPIYQDELMSSPTQGTVYYITGRSGAKYYADLTAKVWDAKFFDPQDQPDYQTVELDGRKVTIKAFKQDGTLVDTYVIDKGHPENNTSNSELLPARYNVKQENPVLGDSLKLIVFGNMAYGSTGKATIVDGQAFADIQTIAAYAEGTYDSAARTLTIKGQKYVFTDDMLTDKGSKVSIMAMNAMGWSNHYDTKFNMVFIEK